MLDDAIKSKMKLYGSILVAVLVLIGMAVLAWHVYDMKTKSQQEPIVVKYEDTKKADELAKKLELSEKTAQQLAARLESIHAGKQTPDVTYYVQAPTLQEAADKTAEQIKDNDASLPAEALAKTDRTVVTADVQKNKVDVYKVNLRNNHKIFMMYQHLDKDWQTLGYMAGRGMAAVSVRDAHRDPHYSAGWVAAQW